MNSYYQLYIITTLDTFLSGKCFDGLRSVRVVREQTIKVLYAKKWWAYQDLNLGPHPYQGCTLTS